MKLTDLKKRLDGVLAEAKVVDLRSANESLEDNGIPAIEIRNGIAVAFPGGSIVAKPYHSGVRSTCLNSRPFDGTVDQAIETLRDTHEW